MPIRFRFSLPSILPILLGLIALAALLPAALAEPNGVPPKPLPPGAVRGVATREALLRAVPNRAAHGLQIIAKGLSVAVFGTQNGFYAAQLRNGRRGYIPTDAVRLAQPLLIKGFTAPASGPNGVPPQPLPPGAVRGVATREALLRAVPNRAAHGMQTIAKGLSVAVTGKVNGFYAARLRNGRQGYIPVDAIRLTQPLLLKGFAAP